MPASNQKIVISKTATDYRAPKPIVVNATPHATTPLSAGAPSSAPTQTEAQTGDGAVPEGAANHPDQGGLAPKPRSAGSTAQIEQGASVDYDHNQASKLTSQGALGLAPSDVSAQQQQEKKRH
jgi:hypothetical protein